MIGGLFGDSLWNKGIAGSFLDKNQLDLLTNQANKSALLTAGLSYLAQPKTGGYGSAIPYIAQAGLQGYGMGQNVFNQAGSQAIQLAGLKRSMMTDLDKLIASRDALPAGDPNRKLYDQQIQKMTTHQPLVNVNTTVPFSEQIQKDIGKDLVGGYTTNKAAPQNIKLFEQAKNVAQQTGKLSGSFAKDKTAIAMFMNNNFGTNIKEDEIAAAQSLNSLLFEPVKANLKKMDATPSQEQQRQMREAFGNLENDPEALQKILQIQQDILAENIKTHNKEVEKFLPLTEGKTKDYVKGLTLEIPEYTQLYNPQDYTKKDKPVVTEEQLKGLTREQKLELIKKQFKGLF